MAMTKDDIIEYVMNTPYNTNKAVLSSMLSQLTEGGGSLSDFSTAEVTITDQLLPPSNIYVQAWIDSNDDKLLAGYDYNSGNYYNFGTNIPFELVLYKSQAVINIATDPARTVTVTVNPDNAVIDNLGDGLYDITITGDCTITIS